MGYVCCVKNCKRENYPGCGIAFHKIPKDKRIAEKWKQVIPGNITTYSVVCAKHFKVEDYCNESRKRLKPEAVPSIFPSTPQDPNEQSVTYNNIVVTSAVRNEDLSDGGDDEEIACQPPIKRTEVVKIIEAHPEKRMTILPAQFTIVRPYGADSISIDDEDIPIRPRAKVKMYSKTTQTNATVTIPKVLELKAEIKRLKNQLLRKANKIDNLRAILHKLRSNRVIVIANEK